MMRVTEPIRYRVVRKTRLKHLYLRIIEGEPTVSAHPSVSDAQIDAFVRSHYGWIQKQLAVYQPRVLLTDTDACVYFLGEAFPVELHFIPDGGTTVMKIAYGICYFFTEDPPQEESLIKARDNYYKAACEEKITPMVEQMATLMRLQPTAIAYRHNKSRWGSCSSQNRLSLNTRLMMLPEEMIRYVVIHELAHIAHKNHSKRFWQLVAQYCPNYKELRRGVRAFEALL